MSFRLMIAWLLAGAAFAAPARTFAADNSTTLTIDSAETAQISGFMEGWDTPMLDARRFDAAHRRLLVRFPGAAKQIAEKLRAGQRIEKVELLLPFHRTEVFPQGYDQRRSFNVGEIYKHVRPRWHAVAWALRKPWQADEELGPTFNAHIAGAGYWRQAGAESDKHDRFPKRFGPTEVSIFQAKNLDDPMIGEAAMKAGTDYALHKDQQPGPEEAVLEDGDERTPARMDVTATLTDRAFGETLGARLRRLADCGFMLRKWETYDFRYRQPGSYPWAASTAGRAIAIAPPRLVVTFTQGDAPSLDLSPATDIAQLAKQLQRDDAGGEPPLTMPDDAEIERRLRKAGNHRQEWMNDWQWQRVQELLSYGGRTLPQNPEQYRQWMKGLLKEQPRYWNGWDNAERLLAYYRYAETLPDYVRQHQFHDYWTAWLQPNTPTDELVHAQSKVAAKRNQTHALNYYRKTFDWRGNASYYRRGYTHSISTMNFNHTASMGALLGGAIIDSEYAMQDGRHGLENYPMRLWAWYDGSTQESIDHYYFALTLVAQKMFADFGPTRLDRMMGRSILAKSVEELASAYHPHLRHFLASSSRTGVPTYLLATQDGVQHVIHTLSRDGALHDLNADEIPEGMERFGNDVSPAEAAQMTIIRPWAPRWFANIVDDKPLPYHMTNRYKKWGRHGSHPLWRRTYLAEHYGLASTDLNAGSVQILGHWRRDDDVVKSVQQLGTMDVWYGVNRTYLGNRWSGARPQDGAQAALQHENKLVMVSSPKPRWLNSAKQIESLQSTIAFYNYEQPKRTWRIFVDSQPVTSLPKKVQPGQRITIHDGLSYIGVIPLPATDLGGGGVVLHRPDPQKSKNSKVEVQAALAIDNYNLKLDEPLQGDALKDKRQAMDRAHNGYVIEYGDASEYGSFAAFRKHLMSAELETDWNAEKSLMDVTYHSGDDTLEMGVSTRYAKGSTDNLFTHRRVNGAWPYLSDGLDRDTTLTQQGRRDRLEKNGAAVLSEPGRMAYLQTEPISGTYAGFNPLPDLSLWAMRAPGDVEVRADGRLGLTRVAVRPKENRLWVSHALKPIQTERPDVASALLVFGMDEAPRVTFHEQPLKQKLRTIDIDGRSAYVVPLRAEVPDDAALRQRYKRTQAALKKQRNGGYDIKPTLLRDWRVIGPLAKDASPEAWLTDAIDFDATRQGANGDAVSWQHSVKKGNARFGGQVNLAEMYGRLSDVSAFAATTVISDAAREATVSVGSDDGITVWVNGERVLHREAYRPARPDQDRAAVQLRKGRNRVLVKVTQAGGGWGFYFRLADRLGAPLTDGIEYQLP